MVAGTLLLAAPAAVAFAAPPGGGPGDPGGPDGPGGGTDTPHGVNGRPSLPRPAPLVTAGQKLGDKLFDNNAKLDASSWGVGYHKLLGGSGTPDNGDNIHQAGEAYQGSYTGVLNMTPLGGVYDAVTGHHSSTAGTSVASVPNKAKVGCGTSTAICKS